MHQTAAPVQVRDVVKWFGPNEAVKGVSFDVAQGEIVALLGPNGAGKTTTIAMLLGLRRPTSGEIRIYGGDPQAVASRQRMGVMLQESGAPPSLKVREIVTWFSRFYPHSIDPAAAIKAADLENKTEALIGTLSGGQKQRLYFALAVVGNPDLLFLDEPSVGMDVEARHAFWDEMKLLGQRGKTIILTTHYLEEADILANRIIVINQGQIVAEGTPSEIKNRVGGKHVRFRATDITPAEAQALPGVVSLTAKDGRFDLATNATETTVRALMQRSETVSDLEVMGAGLEEAFLEITHEQTHA
jgi:ABC-2 type transport system ATP-binding protein